YGAEAHDLRKEPTMAQKYTIATATVLLIVAGIAQTRWENNNSAVAQTSDSPSYNSQGVLQRLGETEKQVGGMQRCFADYQPRIGSFELEPALYEKLQMPDILANGNTAIGNSPYMGDGRPLESCTVIRDMRAKWPGGPNVEF